MARHRDPASGAGGRTATALLAVAALVVIGLIAFAIRGASSGDDDPQAGTQPSASTPAAPTTTGATTTGTTTTGATTTGATTTTSEPTTSEPTTSEPTSSSSSSTTSTTAEAAAPPPELEDCVSEVAAGDDLAKALHGSATHWQAHYGASEDLHKDKIDLDRAKEIWAESKAAGPGDMTATKKATTAYDKASGGCAALSDATVDADFEQAAADCEQRSDAVAEVARTGAKMNDDWSAHLDMMAEKGEMDPDHYLDMWLEMVDNAPTDMRPYEQAVADLKSAPSCSMPG